MQGCETVLDAQDDEQEPPVRGSESTVTAEIIASRRSAMYVVGAAEQQPSGLPPLVREATKAIVKLAAKDMNDLPKDAVTALSESFGNWDRTVGLGWLIADCVLGPPMLERKQAHAVGLKAARAALTIKTDVRAARLAVQRAACKLAPDDPKREELQSPDNAEEQVLRQTINVALPKAPTEPPPAASSSTATGKRKRKKAEEPSPLTPVVAAEAKVLETERAMKRAAATQERAEGDVEAE